MIPARLERVVEVSTEQPGFTFRTELVRAFFDVHALTVHVGGTDVNRSIFIERISGTRAQPETVLIRDGDGTGLSRNRAIIKGDTGTEGPVSIVVVGCTQRDTVRVFKALIFIEQCLAI